MRGKHVLPIVFLILAFPFVLSQDFIGFQDLSRINVCACSSSINTLHFVNRGSGPITYSLAAQGAAAQFSQLSPSGFILEPGKQVNVTQALRIPCGTPEASYASNISVLTGRGRQILPQIITVQSCSNIEILAQQKLAAACPCTQQTSRLRIRNSGSFQETYEFFSEPPSYLSVSQQKLTLKGGGEAEITITLRSPCGVHGTLEQSLIVSALNSGWTAKVPLEYTINPCYNFSLQRGERQLFRKNQSTLTYEFKPYNQAYSFCEGTGGVIPFLIENKAAFENTFNLSIASPQELSSRVFFEQPSITLLSGQQALAPLYVLAPSNISKSYTLSITATAQKGNLSKSALVQLSLGGCFPLRVTAPQALPLAYNETPISIDIENPGLAPISYTLSVLEPAWVSPQQFASELEPGKHETAVFKALPDKAIASPGVYTLRLSLRNRQSGSSETVATRLLLETSGESRFITYLLASLILFAILLTGILLLVVRARQAAPGKKFREEVMAAGIQKREPKMEPEREPETLTPPSLAKLVLILIIIGGIVGGSYYGITNYFQGNETTIPQTLTTAIEPLGAKIGGVGYPLIFGIVLLIIIFVFLYHRKHIDPDAVKAREKLKQRLAEEREREQKQEEAELRRKQRKEEKERLRKEREAEREEARLEAEQARKDLKEKREQARKEGEEQRKRLRQERTARIARKQEERQAERERARLEREKAKKEKQSASEIIGKEKLVKAEKLHEEKKPEIEAQDRTDTFITIAIILISLVIIGLVAYVVYPYLSFSFLNRTTDATLNLSELPEAEPLPAETPIEANKTENTFVLLARTLSGKLQELSPGIYGMLLLYQWYILAGLIILIAIILYSKFTGTKGPDIYKEGGLREAAEAKHRLKEQKEKEAERAMLEAEQARKEREEQAETARKAREEQRELLKKEREEQQQRKREERQRAAEERQRIKKERQEARIREREEQIQLKREVIQERKQLSKELKQVKRERELLQRQQSNLAKRTERRSLLPIILTLFVVLLVLGILFVAFKYWQAIPEQTPYGNEEDILPVENQMEVSEQQVEEPVGIPNQHWNQDSVHYLDLSTYFIDPDGDILEFTYFPLVHMEVEIDGSVAKFTPARGWYGNETIIITASDAKGGVIESNPFRLMVDQVPSSANYFKTLAASISKSIQQYLAYIIAGVVILLLIIVGHRFKQLVTKFLEDGNNGGSNNEGNNGKDKRKKERRLNK